MKRGKKSSLLFSMAKIFREVQRLINAIHPSIETELSHISGLRMNIFKVARGLLEKSKVASGVIDKTLRQGGEGRMIVLFLE
jgi:hypothetical protein